MLKVFIVSLFLLCGSFAMAKIGVSAECRACMSACPHATRDIKECDMGCPKVCTPGEVVALKGPPGSGAPVGPDTRNDEGCFECMSDCPHETRDIKACDIGCPNLCSAEGMRKAFIRVNKKALDCSSKVVGTRSGRVGGSEEKKSGKGTP